MKILKFLSNKEDFFYYVGSTLLVIAIIEVTIFPLVMTMLYPAKFIPLLYHKNLVLSIYVAACVCYFLSFKYYRRQMCVIFLLFIFYCIFQLVVSKI